MRHDGRELAAMAPVRGRNLQNTQRLLYPLGCRCDSPAITLAFLVFSDVGFLSLRGDREHLCARPVRNMSGDDDFKQTIIIKARRGCRYNVW